MEFYLNLQNPKTGAFMDDTYPYCTYSGPTGNVLIHLKSLAKELNQPLVLKYPLKYLDEINTPEKLTAYLDDVSTVGWIATKFPQTSFHFARDLLSLFNEDNTLTEYNLYQASPEFRDTLLQWFYSYQDPKTGLWGPKSKNGSLMKKDVMNSVSILKVFIDEEGNNLYPNLPVRYKEEFSNSILKQLTKTIPDDDELDEWHEWNLQMSKSIKVLLRYLWRDLSDINKEKTKNFIEYYIKLKYEKFYIPEEGGFSYYPYGKNATIDGTDQYDIFDTIGAFSSEKQTYLWGAPRNNVINLGTQTITESYIIHLDSFKDQECVNSLRVYYGLPDYNALNEDVVAIIYPKKATNLDIIDLIPKVKHWFLTTPQTMGNWSSKEETLIRLETIHINAVPIYESELPGYKLKEILDNHNKITLIGFDLLQIPRYQIIYEFQN